MYSRDRKTVVQRFVLLDCCIVLSVHGMLFVADIISLCFRVWRVLHDRRSLLRRPLENGTPSSTGTA